MKTPSVPISVFLVLALPFAVTQAEENKDSSIINLEKLTSTETNFLLEFVQALITAGYEEDKLSVISDFVPSFQEEGANVTLVGIQNIYNADGSLKEIRTIELFLPISQDKLQKKSSGSLSLKEVYVGDDFNTDDIERIRDIRDTIYELSRLGLDLELCYVETDRHGKEETLFYLTKDLLVANYYNLYFVNKTIHLDNSEEILPVKPGSTLESILYYDNKGKFIKDKSRVQPELFASVESETGSPDPKIVKSSLESLVDVVLETQNKNDIPEELRKRLKGIYPDLTFMVTSDNPVGQYINEDFSLNVKYDFVVLDFAQEYYVSGYNATV